MEQQKYPHCLYNLKNCILHFILLIIFGTHSGCVFSSNSLKEPSKGNFNSKDFQMLSDVKLLPEKSYGNVTIKFSEFTMEPSPWSHQITSEEIKLRIYGIYGLSRDEVLVYGGLAAGGYFRSFLLHSGDGGHSWKEVAVPIELGYVSEIFFIDGGIGWMLADRSPEGIENVYLFQTVNFGKSWMFIGQVPNRGEGSYNTLGLRFVDPNYGEVWMETVQPVDNGNDIEEFCLCKTNDGALSWQITDMCIPRNKFDYNWISPNISTTTSGTQWRYEFDRTDKEHQWILIQRKIGKQHNWETVSFLPLNLVYKQGVLNGEIKLN